MSRTGAVDHAWITRRVIDCRVRGPGSSGVPREHDVSGCVAAGLGEVLQSARSRTALGAGFAAGHRHDLCIRALGCVHGFAENSALDYTNGLGQSN